MNAKKPDLTAPNLEQFRINVVASDERLLNEYKELLILQFTAEKKAYEYQLRDMDRKEAQELANMESKTKKSRVFSDQTM